MEGERKGTLGRSRGTWGKYPRATETNDGRLRCARNGASLVNVVGATTMERAKLREGEMRERASSSEGFKYKDTEACAVLSY